jgi:tetratricopeptide (TPR) repeat protein
MPSVEITASDHSVAAHSIETLNLTLEAPARTRAAAPVLPVELLVADDAPFIGRQGEIERLRAVFDSPSDGIVIVTGPPGVGKSALTRQAVERARTGGRFEHVLFADLRGYEDDPASRVQPDEMYGPLLRSVGVRDGDIPSSAAQQAGLYHQVMDTLAVAGKPVLLWLDNVSDRKQFDSLRPASPVHKIAIATRESFGHIANRRVVDLDVLDVPEAVAVIAAAAEKHDPTELRFRTEPDAAAQLAELCDGLPLALQIVAALLADEPQRPIAELVTELTGEEDRLSGLDYETNLSVRAALTLSYQRLSDHLRRLFRLLSVVPSGDVGLQAVGWLLGASPSAVRPQLMALVRAHLIEQHVPNRWSMHDLIRLYSAEQTARHPDDADAAFKRVLGNYFLYVTAASEWLTAVVSNISQEIFPSPEQASEWFQAERPTAISLLKSACGSAEYHDTAVLFGVILGSVLQQQRHWLQDLYDVSAMITPLAPHVKSKRVGAGALNLYGGALEQQGHLDEALEVFKQADKIYDESPDSGPAGALRTNVATMFVHQGRIDEAIELYRQDIKVCRELAPPDRFNEARILVNIGAALNAAKRFGEAVEPLRQAIAIMRALHDLPGVATASTNLGVTLQQVAADQKDWKLLEEAVNVLEEALEIYAHRRNESKWANAAVNLAIAQLALGRTDDGAATMMAAYGYFEKHQPERAEALRKFFQLRNSPS